MIWGNTIKKRVMAVLEEKLKTTQQHYVTECKIIDDKAEEDKEKLADKLVNEIVGKWM